MRCPSKTWTTSGIALVVLTISQACLDGDLSPLPDETNTPYQGERSACSTGPALSSDVTLPAGPTQSMQPECVPRCGTHPLLTWGPATSSVSTEGVPSGACTFEGEACSMVAVKACCAGGTNGVAYVYECRCTRGNWGCTAAYHGGGACGLCTPEGTAEPGTPAVSDAGAGDAG